ncbi:MAG TPA: nucleotidyltransferase family protein [Casimicrobiaceae bacterium]|nr:nucleotidyltransferase family protein [Casimicrobiaceae bacterium]
MTSAMILAAGRGERMRPLTDDTPKPLLRAGGKPLIVWQIEALARAGFTDIVINVAHRGDLLMAALGDGAALGVRILWSSEGEPLETAGGVATALPLLRPGPALIVSGDIWTSFDYASLAARIDAMANDPAAARAHMVMVPNPPYHPEGDFALQDGRVALASSARLTFGNIGIYDTALFAGLPPRVRLKMLPLYRDWIGRGIVSGERYDGPWANVGTPDDLRALDAMLEAATAVPPTRAGT